MFEFVQSHLLGHVGGGRPQRFGHHSLGQRHVVSLSPYFDFFFVCSFSFFSSLSYVGRYVRDLRNGEGTLRWPNGDTFVGTWKNGGRFGPGLFTDFASKTTVQQVWQEEEKIQYSKYIPARHPTTTK